MTDTFRSYEPKGIRWMKLYKKSLEELYPIYIRDNDIIKFFDLDYGSLADS